MIKNPWRELKWTSDSYILKSDKIYIEGFNKNILKTQNNDSIVQSKVLPEPFLGNSNAKVVLLLLNPGFKEKEIRFHKQTDFKLKLIKSIQLRSKNPVHFYLNEDFDCGGRRWWKKALKSIANGDDEIYKCIAKNIFSIEYFPYHSKKFKQGTLRLPSQNYSFHLVREAIKRKAYIICGRGRKYWFRTTSVQNSF